MPPMAMHWALLLLLLPLLPVSGGRPVELQGPSGTEEYYWFKRGGTYVGHGAVPWEVPTNFEKKPAWTWDNPDDELWRHGPVMDGEKNVYAVTSRGRVRKFDQDGKLLWSWNTSLDEGSTVTSPFLYKGRLYFSCMGKEKFPSKGSYLLCLSMATGELIWKAPSLRKDGWINMDSSTVHVAEDTILVSEVDGSKFAPDEEGGNNRIFAMNATDGSHLWHFTLDKGVLWNFMPSTPGDGTFFFATSCASAQRRRLSDGSVVWESWMPGQEAGMCGTGGGTLGPNGVFYAEGNLRLSEPLMNASVCDNDTQPLQLGKEECVDGYGILVAYNASDGTRLWARRLGTYYGGFQYPTVGMLNGRLVVVCGVGHNPNLPKLLFGEEFLPFIVRFILFHLQRLFLPVRLLLGHLPKFNGVRVYDAKTAEEVWSFDEPTWWRWAALGDEETIHSRWLKAQEDPRIEIICGPDNWGIPAITSDGKVLIGSGSTGVLYSIQDRNGDGVIAADEVSSLQTAAGFLNGPALAPGMMAVSPCWGPMLVFKSDDA